MQFWHFLALTFTGANNSELDFVCKILSCKQLINSLHLVYFIYVGPCKRAPGKATWPLGEFVLVISTIENIKGLK